MRFVMTVITCIWVTLLVNVDYTGFPAYSGACVCSLPLAYLLYKRVKK